MRIKRLHIGDFGILQNQTLEDLHPGLVIVGGHNRAGKSTFMQVLRFLGYGIPRASLPPANVEYMIDADVWEEVSDTDYHIRLQGHSEPVCTVAGEGNRIPARELYPIDAFTYKNLYTISLDQLARQPEGIDNKDMDRLQSALLGAGLSDIANIPRLQNKFTKNADNIGGVRGDPNVKGFKLHFQLIKNGSAKKKDALAQVEEYNRQQNHLSELQNKEKSIGRNLVKLQAERDVLETIKSNYEVLEEVIALGRSLELQEGTKVHESLKWENRARVEDTYESYREMKDQWQELFSELAGSLEKRDQAEKIQSLLLRYRARLQSFVDRLSGLQEKWNNLDSVKRRLRDEKQKILSQIRQLKAGWTEEEIARIRRINLELPEQHRLMDEANRFQVISNKLEQAEIRRDESKDKAERLKIQIAEWKKHAPAHGLKLYLWVFVLAAVLGLAVYFVQPAAGLFLGLFGIIGSALFVFFKGLGQKEAGLRLKELKGELEAILTDQDKMQQEAEQLWDQRKEIESYLSAICSKLGLEESTAPNGVYEYYRTIFDIQQRIFSLDGEEKELNVQLTLLAGQLSEIDGVIAEFEKISAGLEDMHHTSGRDVLQPDAWQDIQIKLRKWHGLMNTAVELDQISEKIKGTVRHIHALMGHQGETDNHTVSPEASLEDQVGNYLSMCSAYSEYQEKVKKRDTLRQSLERAASSDRIRKAFSMLGSEVENQEQGGEQKPIKDDNFLLQQLFRIFNKYPVRDALEREYESLLAEIANQEQELETCRKNIHQTNMSLEQLSLTKELEEAHEMIQKGRSGLFQASYDYAVHRAAAWLCSEIRNEFMTGMKDELLVKADGILRQLTGEDYQRIIPSDNLSDFSFVLKDGSRQENSQILSRGTREQVFLAVRLGRILEMQPPLPVIIDDSFVNFDCAHLKNAVDVIGSLSRTHQVFIMTCHPHLVELFTQTGTSSGPPAQYWRLDKGRFSPSGGLELMEYLSQEA
jgi:uncharacterized protein YhaN